jgi:hypothetical protein
VKLVSPAPLPRSSKGKSGHRPPPWPSRKGGGVREEEVMLYLSNSFSLSMLGASLPPEGLTVKVRPVSLEEVKALLQAGYQSAVGHSSTAQVLAALLGLPVEANRVAIQLVPGDQLVVFQLKMRLEEGRVLTEDEVKALYEQGLTSFYLVEVLG